MPEPGAKMSRQVPWFDQKGRWSPFPVCVGGDDPAQPGGELRAQRDRDRAGDVPGGGAGHRPHVHGDGAVGEQSPYVLDRQGG